HHHCPSRRSPGGVRAGRAPPRSPGPTHLASVAQARRKTAAAERQTVLRRGAALDDQGRRPRGVENHGRRSMQDERESEHQPTRGAPGGGRCPAESGKNRAPFSSPTARITTTAGRKVPPPLGGRRPRLASVRGIAP